MNYEFDIFWQKAAPVLFSLFSDVTDVILMTLRRPKFVRILTDQNKINRTIFNDKFIN